MFAVFTNQLNYVIFKEKLILHHPSLRKIVIIFILSITKEQRSATIFIPFLFTKLIKFQFRKLSHRKLRIHDRYKFYCGFFFISWVVRRWKDSRKFFLNIFLCMIDDFTISDKVF